MTQGHLASDPLSPPTQEQIRAACQRFEEAWQRGPPPSIAEFLRATDGELPGDGPVRAALLCELVMIDLGYRWRRAGELETATGGLDDSAGVLPPPTTLLHKPLLEDYLRLYADLGPLDKPPVELIGWEYRIRTQCGERPAKAEYDSRFPSQSSAVAIELARIDRELGGDPSATANAISGSRYPDLPGYEILEELGQGGMGVVYKARQFRPERMVAVKLVRADKLEGLGADERERAINRFRTEAEATARIQHEHLVTVYEVGDLAGRPFYSMRYVEGRSLASLLRDGPLDQRRAAAYMEPIARAVHEAHRQGVIHRDLKPSNILIDVRTDRSLVADFGLAKLTEGAGQDMTQTGDVFGSPPYMSPEQAFDASRAAAPADVYSLGATLYHALTGRPPFQAATSRETLRQVLEVEPLPPRRLNRAIDRDLETICLKCLQKQPRDRYADAESLAEDLRRYQLGEPILARRVRTAERAWRWCKRRPAVASLLVLMLLLILGGWQYLRVQRQRANVERARTAVQALLDTSADGVPFAVERLREPPLGEHAIPILRAALRDDSAPDTSHLHAACALAHLVGSDGLAADAPLQRYLIERVSDAPDAECQNIVTALGHADPGAVRDQLLALAAEAPEPQIRFRYAATALWLGDPRAAQASLAQAPDPVHRTTFVLGLATWRADLAPLADVLRTTDDADLRSGLCQALGRFKSDSLPEAERGALVPVLQAVHQTAPDPATHSSAGWALRQWGVESPAIAATNAPVEDRRWFVNTAGMTLLEIPAGTFTMGTVGADETSGELPHEVTLTRPFYLADREVTIGQFQAFIDDPAPALKKPTPAWEGAYQFEGSTPDYPVRQVSWFDAIQFCNWLSKREGLPACYKRTGEKQAVKDYEGKETGEFWDIWTCDFDADGYRLPTEAEWEHACRGGTTTAFGFGNDEAAMASFGVCFPAQSTAETGGRLPNSWGLFDMHGNVWEWCWDRDAAYSPGPVSDPAGPARGDARVLRGGACDWFASYCRSATRYSFFPPTDHHSHNRFGFRVGVRVP